MDSLTQLALGAAVGEASIGRQVGNKAILWGAVLGTLPDLDVFIPLGGPVEDFTYHRSFSHSLFVLALLTPLMVWLILKLHPQTREHRGRWALMVYLVFATHVLLDSFTVYGTQIFWPIIMTPQSWSTLFIIDPSYTLPLLVGVIAALVMSRRHDRGHLVNTVGLALSTLYLAWSLGAKLYVESVARDSLARQGIEYQRLLSTPAPFNTLLWRLVAMGDDGYFEGYYSFLDGHPEVSGQHHNSRVELLESLAGHWPVARLQWFTHGFYKVSEEEDAVVISDLRMGLEGDYVFRFQVGEMNNPHPRPVTARRMQDGPRNTGRLARVWDRLWDPGVQP